MAWFRRRRATPSSELVPVATSTDLVPLVSSHALERAERALRMLATQSAQLHENIVRLEARIDALAGGTLDRLDAPTYDDVMDVRLHSAKVASEVSRLEVNVASRIDALRAEVRATQDPDIELDLRIQAPFDTAWMR